MNLTSLRPLSLLEIDHGEDRGVSSVEPPPLPSFIVTTDKSLRCLAYQWDTVRQEAMLTSLVV